MVKWLTLALLIAINCNMEDHSKFDVERLVKGKELWFKIYMTSAWEIKICITTTF